MVGDGWMRFRVHQVLLCCRLPSQISLYSLTIAAHERMQSQHIKFLLCGFFSRLVFILYIFLLFTISFASPNRMNNTEKVSSSFDKSRFSYPFSHSLTSTRRLCCIFCVWYVFVFVAWIVLYTQRTNQLTF